MNKSIIHVSHPFAPVFDKNSKILILGSFPSVKSRENMFYYGNPKNRFWDVLAAVFGDSVPVTNEEKVKYLKKHEIALWDSIAQCDIEGSSDSSIKNAVPNDICALFKKTGIKKIYLNGNMSAEVYKKYILPLTGIEGTLLPSTSPANARSSLEALTEKWKTIRE